MGRKKYETYLCTKVGASRKDEITKRLQHMQIEAVMRTDDHHIAKHNKILRMKNKHDIQLVFLGDSLTRRWEDNIGIWDKYFSAYNAANFVVGGDCLENIEWRT